MAHKQSANFPDYPARGAEVSACKEGMQMARIVDMTPQEPGAGGEKSWRARRW